jgi:hypothetical protein
MLSILDLDFEVGCKVGGNKLKSQSKSALDASFFKAHANFFPSAK